MLGVNWVIIPCARQTRGLFLYIIIYNLYTITVKIMIFLKRIMTMKMTTDPYNSDYYDDDDDENNKITTIMTALLLLIIIIIISAPTSTALNNDSNCADLYMRLCGPALWSCCGDVARKWRASAPVLHLYLPFRAHVYTVPMLNQ